MPPNNVLNVIADNQILFDALKEVIKKQFDLDNLNPNMTNENLGQVVRSRLDGLILVERAFQEIERHKTPENRPLDMNPAR